MASFFVKVQLRRDVFFNQRLIKPDAVFRQDASVFGGVPKETGGRLLRYLFFIGQFHDQFRRRVLADQVPLGAAMREVFSKGNHRIAKNSKVRSVGDLGGRVGSFLFSIVEMSGCRRSQMAASRKTKDPNLVGL